MMTATATQPAAHKSEVCEVTIPTINNKIIEVTRLYPTFTFMAILPSYCCLIVITYSTATGFGQL